MPGAAVAGVASIGGAVLGAKASSKAASKAADAERYAADLADRRLREGAAYADEAYQPYIDEGDQARALTNPFFGITTNPAASRARGAAASATRAAMPTLEQVLREQNPQAAAVWDKWEANIKDKSYGPSGHRGMYGDFAGFVGKSNPNAVQQAQATLNQRIQDAQAQETQQAAADQTSNNALLQTQRAAADAAFEANPLKQNATKFADNLNALVDGYASEIWNPLGGGPKRFEDSQQWQMADRATQRANDEFMSRAGASGSALSGRTARGLQENEAYIRDDLFNQYVAQQQGATNAVMGARTGANSDIYAANDNAFLQYLNQMNGIADRGANATSAVANAHLGVGSQSAQIAQNTGNALANLYAQKGDSTGTAIQGAANTLAWLGGQYSQNKGSGYTPKISTATNTLVAPSNFSLPTIKAA